MTNGPHDKIVIYFTEIVWRKVYKIDKPTVQNKRTGEEKGSDKISVPVRLFGAREYPWKARNFSCQRFSN